MKGRAIMVSVLVLSYNQERYIKKTLDSILEQEADFPIEILVGDDASTDGTPDIIRGYAEEYPHLFRAFLRKRNLGSAANLSDIVSKAKGLYLASCEGDDYWCDVNKLQKQVDFLEEHQEFSACATSYYYVDADGNEIPTQNIPDWERANMSNEAYRNIYTIDDFNEARLPSQGAAVVSRNVYLEADYSDLFKAARNIADQLTILLLLKRGNIYIMKDKTVCYRRLLDNSGTSWMSRLAGHVFHQYEWFQLMMLYRKAGRKLGLKVTREIDIKQCFFHLADRFLRYPTRGKLACLYKMIKMSDDKMHHLIILMQAIYLASTYPVVRNLYPIKKEDSIYKKVNKKWSAFWNDLQGKKLVVYGAGGGGIDLFHEYYDKLPVELLVDSNEGRANTWFFGYMIHTVSDLDKMDKDNTVVLITTGYYYRDVILNLEERGFFHYYVYPIMERKRWRNKPLDWLPEYISNIR